MRPVAFLAPKGVALPVPGDQRSTAAAEYHTFVTALPSRFLSPSIFQLFVSAADLIPCSKRERQHGSKRITTETVR